MIQNKTIFCEEEKVDTHPHPHPTSVFVREAVCWLPFELIKAKTYFIVWILYFVFTKMWHGGFPHLVPAVEFSFLLLGVHSLMEKKNKVYEKK